jgi:putative membrane-bound dehydrogenase-like protein
MVRTPVADAFVRSVLVLLAAGSFAAGSGLAAQQAPVSASPASKNTDPNARRLQVLLLGAPTRNGPHHDPITRYATLKKGLGTAGIDLTYSEDPASAFTAEGLQPFDAVLLYGNWDQQGVLPEAQRKALFAYVENGGGFVPVHCASACWGRSPEFVRLVGARFLRHGGEEFAVDNVAKDHPVLTGLPSFRAWDETYEHDEQAGDRVILQRRGEEPWTWVRTQGKGRVFYTASGHDHRVWDKDEFQQLLRNGLLWAVGDDKRALLANLQLPQLEQEDVSLPGYRERREITKAQKPLSAEQSQKLATVPVGMQLQLFASEPDIVNPIHVAWDAHGRAFVVETIDYPNNLQKGDLGHDRITVCEDTDGDGKADRFTRFCEKLSIPTSLCFADGGVICTNGSDVLFLRDTDGDLRADERRVLFTGFSMGDTHAGVSNLRWERDGYVYATVGYSGFRGEVGGERHDFAQGVFRFRPDGSKLEFLQHTTNNTWGLGTNAVGDVVGSTANGNPSWFLTFADAAYQRAGMQTHVTPRADSDPLFFPSSRDIRQVDFFDRFTSAAGHAIYTATRFPADYRERAAFVCEPTGKLVATFHLERRGGGFRAVQSPNNLYSSADAWSAPVCAEVGPDGAVWICDWYNLIVQHNPTPTRGSAGVDAKTGRGNAYETPLRDTQHGRIWRVFPAGSKDEAAPAFARSKDAKAAELGLLLAGLGHDSLLWRLHAQRLLGERGDDAMLPPLAALAATGSQSSPHALWLLAANDALTDTLLATTLRSRHEPTRRAALQLANVAVLKSVFVGDGPLPLAGRDLAELLVRFCEAAADPAIGAAILRTGQAAEAAIFDDVTLRDAWQMAARRHRGTVLAAAKAAGIQLGVRAEPTNLLPNGAFDDADGERADGERPRGWTDLRIYSGAGADQVAFGRDATGGRDGSPALRVRTPARSDCGVAALVQVKGGTRYRLSGWIKTDDVTTPRGADGVMLNVHGGVRTQGVKGTQDWTLVQAEFDAEADGELVVHCLFGGYGGAKGTAWFDDVSLVAIGSGASLVGALEALAEQAKGTAAAEAPAQRVHAIDAAVHERGAAVFARTCIACHGLDGRGVPPVFPPLDGSEWLAGDPTRAIDVVLHGLMGPITVRGANYNSLMAPLAGTLSDQEIADALTYVRQRWSNDQPPVTADMVKARRSKHAGRTTPWTAAELPK